VTRGIGTLEGLIGDAYYYGHWVTRTTRRQRAGTAAPPPRAMRCASTLGDMYYYGRDVPQDFVSAATWWQLAADQGRSRPAQPQRALRQWRRRRAGLVNPHVREIWPPPSCSRRRSRDRQQEPRHHRQAMTPAQLAEAQRMAREWRPKEAE